MSLKSSAVDLVVQQYNKLFWWAFWWFGCCCYFYDLHNKHDNIVAIFLITLMNLLWNGINSRLQLQYDLSKHKTNQISSELPSHTKSLIFFFRFLKYLLTFTTDTCQTIKKEKNQIEIIKYNKTFTSFRIYVEKALYVAE